MGRASEPTEGSEWRLLGTYQRICLERLGVERIFGIGSRFTRWGRKERWGGGVLHGHEEVGIRRVVEITKADGVRCKLFSD